MPQFLKDMARTTTDGRALPGRREKRKEMGGWVKRAPDPGIFGNKRFLSRPKLRKELSKGPSPYTRKERFERADRLLKDMGPQVSPWEVGKKIKILKKVVKRPDVSPTRQKGIKKDIAFLEAIKGNKDEK